MGRLYDLEQEVISEVEERFQDEGFGKYESDVIHEIVDGSIPYYTADLLECALDNLWMATEEPEVYGFDGAHTAVNAVVGNLYKHLCEIAIEALDACKERAEEETDEEDGVSEEGGE